MTSNNSTWEEIQATLARQQYLPQLQSQVPQQQPQQQLPNQYGGHTLRGQQFAGQPQAQNTFAGKAIHLEIAKIHYIEKAL